MNHEEKNMEAIVSDYCTILPTPVFIFSAWEKLQSHEVYLLSV
jgi:hypothetical protein